MDKATFHFKIFLNKTKNFSHFYFSGQLSPENVQRVVSEALNTTQQKASEYYYWVYEKVHTTIKWDWKCEDF